MEQSEIVIYKTEEGKTKIDVKMQNETVWLDQKAIASLFDVNVPAISKHIINIYKEGELIEESTISKMETVQKEGDRVVKKIDIHNDI